MVDGGSDWACYHEGSPGDGSPCVCVTARFKGLFSPAKNTMQLFMWQRDIVGVAHYIMDCFEVLGALDDAPDDASTLSSSALAAG